MDNINIDWNFPDSSKSKGIHSIHPYPAKFIPEIPRSLIELFPPIEGSIVFDPFCGSGTTLYESQHAGFESIGVDLNPIACLISKVKTTDLQKELVDQAESIVLKAKRKRNLTVPDIPNLDHWFTQDVQRAVTSIKNEIFKVDKEILRSDLMLCLSSILVRVSNQDSDTRYAAVEKVLSEELVYESFLRSANKLYKFKTESDFESKPVKVINKNILDLGDDDFEGKKIGLVVTSPPYPNAYEYWLYHKYRMFWLGYDPIKVKQNEIGARAHYFKKNPPTSMDFQNQMKQLFEVIWRNSLTNAKVCFVIGRSKIHGQIIDNANLLIEAATSIGFEVIGNVEREIASSRKSFNLSHGKIKKENLLVFNRP